MSWQDRLSGFETGCDQSGQHLVGTSRRQAEAHPAGSAQDHGTDLEQLEVDVATCALAMSVPLRSDLRTALTRV